MPNGTPDYNIDLNFSGGPGGEFRVRDYNGGSPTVAFKVNAGGTAFLYGDVRRSAAVVLCNASISGGGTILQLAEGTGSTARLDFTTPAIGNYVKIQPSVSGDNLALSGYGAPVLVANSSSGSVDIVHFRSNSTERATVSWDDTNSVAQFESDENVLIHFGKGYTSGKTFKFKAKSTGVVLTQLADTGVWQFKDSSGNTEAQLIPLDGNDDCELTLGIDDTTRGKLVLERDGGSGSERPGVVLLVPDDTTSGSTLYLYAWYDTTESKTGLFVSDTDPGTTGPGAGASVNLAYI